MTTQRPFILRYDDAVREHLRWIDRKYHALIRQTAVLVAVLEEEALESLLLAYQQDFWAMLDAASRNIAQTGGIAHEEFWQSVEQKS